MACLALLPATSADVAFASTFDGRAMQILIHGVLLDTSCCMKNVVISLQRVNGRMGTLFCNLRYHFLQCSLHHVLLGIRPGNPLRAHLIESGSVIQAKFSGGALSGRRSPNQLLRACRIRVRSESRRVVAAGDVMTVPTKKPSGPGRIVFQQTCVRGFRHLLGGRARRRGRERGSEQMSKSESQVCVLCQSRNQPKRASGVVSFAQPVTRETWQSARRMIRLPTKYRRKIGLLAMSKPSTCLPHQASKRLNIDHSTWIPKFWAYRRQCGSNHRLGTCGSVGR
jgi:hypothetical protein